MVKKVIVAGMLAISMCGSLMAATIFVGPNDFYTTLHAAYNAASDGDMIVVRNGNITTQGFSVSKDVDFSTDGSVRTVTFSNASPISINNNNVSFENLKFVSTNSTQPYIIYVSYLVDGFHMYNCELTGSAQKGLFDYGSLSSFLNNAKFNSTSTGYYAEDARHVEIVGYNTTFSNPNVNLENKRTISVDIGYLIMGGITMNSGYANSARCITSYNPNTSYIPYIWVEGVQMSSVGNGAYPIFLDGVNTVGLMANIFNYCPSVAWATVNGVSTVNEFGNTFYSCSHP